MRQEWGSVLQRRPHEKTCSVSQMICQGLLSTADGVLITQPQSRPSFVMALALVFCPPLKLSVAGVCLSSGTDGLSPRRLILDRPCQTPPGFRRNTFHSWLVLSTENLTKPKASNCPRGQMSPRATGSFCLFFLLTQHDFEPTL